MVATIFDVSSSIKPQTGLRFGEATSFSRTQTLPLPPNRAAALEDATQLLKIPNSECPDIEIRVPHKWPKSWLSIENPVVLLERNLYGPLFGKTFVGKQFEKLLLKCAWWNVSIWECLFVHREKILSVYVDDIKFGAEKNLDPMLKLLNKEVDLEEPTSFLDHVYMGCTQRQCQLGKNIVDNYRTIFESNISTRATEKLPCSENLRNFFVVL